MLLQLKYVLLFLYVTIVTLANAQETVYFDPGDLKGNTMDLLPSTSVFVDPSRTLTLPEIRQVEMLDYHHAKDVGYLKSRLFEQNIWLKLKLKPTLSMDDDEVSIHFPDAARIELYEISGDIINYSKGGRFQSVNEDQLVNNKYAFPLRVLDTIEREIYIKIASFDRFGKELTLSHTSDLKLARLASRESRFVEINYYVALISIFLFTGFLILIRFIQIREKYMLWYGLYLIALALYFLQNYEYMSKVYLLFEYFGFMGISIKLLVPILFYLLTFYIRDILEIDNEHELYKYYRTLISFAHFTFITTFFFIAFSGINSVSEGLRMLFVIPFLLASTLFAIRSIFTNERLNKIVGIGLITVSLACFVLTCVFILNLFGHYHVIFEISLVIELCLLNAAIAYKVNQVNKSLLNAKESLLVSEKKNLRFQKKLNEELNELVAQKTEDIIEQSKQIALQENLKVEAEFKERIANAELKALKAQMNPHFIFNCLNAIRNLILKDESEKATRYLGVFSSFIRKVLNYSEVREITLEEELELCKLYLQMEQLRFEDGFRFEINVDPNSAIDFVKVPPMLLQPILENAIWHGLLHKPDDRLVCIHISQSESEILCAIEDNGIGRAAAQNNAKGKKASSMGLRLFNDRLQIKNSVSQEKYHYDIIDKYENGIAVGTKVKLYFEI